MRPTIITALKPSGRPHLGNYVGAIAPTLALAYPDVDVAVFVADGHALNTIRTASTLRANVVDIVATYLACGLDPARVLLFRQSDVPEIFELASILACVCPKGTANRAHAYKAQVAKNLERGVDPDTDVNMGLFSYPVLMAADILGVGATIVPVGPDQVQHVEVARELARRFNHAYDDVLPEPSVSLAVTESLPGIDGRKMSKSYDNTIPLFAPERVTRQRIAKIRTSSRAVGEPGDAAQNLVFIILSAVANDDTTAYARTRLLEGAGDGELKGLLFEVLRDRFGESRARYQALVEDPETMEAILGSGAVRARERCGSVLTRVKAAAGLGPAVQGPRPLTACSPCP